MTSVKGNGKGKGTPPPCPPALPKSTSKGPKELRNFSGQVRHWPIRLHEAMQLDDFQQHAFSLPVEDGALPSFQSCRIFAACILGRMGPIGRGPHIQWGPTPRRLVDTMLPYPSALEAAVSAVGQTADSSASVSAGDIQVQLDRLMGSPLKYTIAPHDTCAALKIRVAEDLGVPTFMVILMLGVGPYQPAQDVPLSTYCSSGDEELRLTLIVSLRDVCVIASRGDAEDKAAGALGVLMKRAHPGDDLVIDAARECIGNGAWDSPLILPALHLLRKVLPSDVACAFFGACAGCCASSRPAVTMVGRFGIEALCRLEQEQGQDFVAACMRHSNNSCIANNSLPVEDILLYLRDILEFVGPLQKASPCVRPSAAVAVPRDLLQVVSAHLASYKVLCTIDYLLLPYFRVVMNFEEGVANAAWKLCSDASSYPQVCKRYSAIGEALQEQAEALGLSLQDVLPQLQVTIVDNLGYPPSSCTEKTELRVMMQHTSVLNHGKDLAMASAKYRASLPQCDAEFPTTGALCNIILLSCVPSEHARLALEALAMLAPSGDKNALRVACLSSTHRDAAVREQALEFIVRHVSSANLEYVGKLLKSRHDPHAKRIWKEVELTFQK